MARPKFRFNEQHRRLVKSLAGMAVRQDHICKLVGPRSPKTLRKHFRAELDYGFAQACAAVARTAYDMATSGRYPQMSMFWDKCQTQLVPEEREEQKHPKPRAHSGSSGLIVIHENERSRAA